MKTTTFWFFVVAILASGCSTTPSKSTTVPGDSHDFKAYQKALDNAFAELDRESALRSPAAEGDIQTFAANFQKTQYFDVLVTPKLIKLGLQPDSAKTRLVNADTERFQFRIDRQGHCALAGDLVADADRAQCVQVEIKPINPKIPGKQFVRVFMTPEYRVFGVSYHDFNPNTQKVERTRRLIQWDQSEPLSSELLSLAKDVVPLDLPIYATNRLTKEPGDVKLKDPRSGSCQGWNYHYKNTYGSWVTAGWCSNDPWPSIVETNRYLAVLVPAQGR